MPFDSEHYTETKPQLAEPWRQVLLDAADYIEAHGLAKGRLCDEDGRRCAVGGIYRSSLTDGIVDTSDAAREAHNRMSAYIRFRHGGRVAVSSWNNAPGRTAAEVCAALRACAA